MSQPFDEIFTRGVAEVIGKEQLEKKLCEKKKLRIKLGIDPTSPNLHIGRSVQLLKLRDFQQLGHQIVLIIGDFTGVIGDTSDKESERPMLSKKLVAQNLATYRKQAGKILDMEKVEFHYNSKWLKKLGYWEICEQADVFSLAEFIARDNIKKRLTAGTRVSLRELLYPLMQGFDSVTIKSDVELGGTDQRFNMLAGRDLQKHYGQDTQSVITMNLLLGTDGRKMSSSWGNTINLTDAPNDMYGKIMSIPDTLITTYFIHCTRIVLDEIQQIEQHIKNNTLNPRDAKMRLAREVVTLYHGAKKALNAEKQFINIFQKKELPKGMPTIKLSKKEWNIIDLLVETHIASSKTDARRLIEQKGISLNEVGVFDIHQSIIIPTKGIVIKRGKRTFINVTLTHS